MHKNRTNHVKFSIVLPTYNAASTIEAALESIFQQAYDHYEVIVIDGGSSDSTVCIVDRYTVKDPRFTCFVESDNGIYDGMNKGVIKAKGEWLFFLGSDDTLYDNEVLKNVAITIMTNPDTRFVYGNVKLNKSLGYHHEGLIYAGEFTAAKLLTKNICHQSAFYHRSLFREFGLFRTQYRIFADYDFNLRCFNRARPVFVDRIIANFNVGGQSKDNQNLDRLFEKDFVENMILHYAFPYKSSFFDGKKNEIFLLMKKRFAFQQLRGTIRTVQILSYQTIKGLVRKKTSLFSKQNQ